MREDLPWSISMRSLPGKDFDSGKKWGRGIEWKKRASDHSTVKVHALIRTEKVHL